jgi:hypothetical protein
LRVEERRGAMLLHLRFLIFFRSLIICKLRTKIKTHKSFLRASIVWFIVAIGYSITRYTTTKTIASWLLGNNCVEVEASKMLLTLHCKSITNTL